MLLSRELLLLRRPPPAELPTVVFHASLLRSLSTNMIIYLTKVMGEDNGFAAIQARLRRMCCSAEDRVSWGLSGGRLSGVLPHALLPLCSPCRSLAFAPPMPPLSNQPQLNLFEGTCYLTPLLGAWLADSAWGRYKTILIFSFIYLLVSWLAS